MNGRILLVEDDDSLREILAFNLEDAGFSVDTAENGRQALEKFDPTRHETVITDLRMPEMNGMELLSELLERDPAAVVVVVTAYGNTERALEAMRRGAFHYVEKPVNNLALQTVINKAVDYRRSRRENTALKQRVQRGERPALIASSPAMNEVLRLVDKVAPSDATILIQGESGTGKELIARAIHERSERADARFVAINCAAIPSELLESILFGHEKGAFTGAHSASEGKFAAAHGGTLFLDEIAEMSAKLQSKLLRVLQEGEIEVIGANQPVSVDVRVLAATHQNLKERVDRGEFRQDLFFRLNVIPLRIPPLRERREDIPVLFRFFLRHHAEGEGIEVDRAVDDALLKYDWPGNVRELQNIVERMILLRDGARLTLADVPDILRPDAGFDVDSGALPFQLPEGGLDLMALEKTIILAALAKMDGNQSATARYLNIPRHVLLYRLEKYEVDDDEPDAPK
ncbi:sigma-54-dependent transcriptional regulator [Bradymonas sediminis]|uniref:Sigma-54-dependent Fis family transcriptional regulator n=1 Tax=Bradymonas sediminis TaxID=1548548 RepID=A0A2Z4FIN9_9DELT|nr:sigma-54 dependent transcriptional regulator [Bradymonas sediminis]AWV88665.1 sigma-54-dependent Fis family transcriptional regulator [Bradymonas sediminis]TDP63650.1 two component Fis family sigma54 specific transcriptional regulator [Bradymonas sediminis]